MSRVFFFFFFLPKAGAGQAICEGGRVRHSYMGSQPGLYVPKVLASCDSVMRVSCREGGPYSWWNLILAVSAVKASANYDFILRSISSVLSGWCSWRTTPSPLHLQLEIQVAQSGVHFSYSNGSSNSSTVSFTTIKFPPP